MGLFVVSRLAQRHGIAVSLERNAHNGTTAVVLIPSAILEIPTPAAPASAPSRGEEPAEAPSEGATGPAVMPGPPTLEERLNAVTGLPQRRPGAQTPILGLPIPDEPAPADEAEPAGEPAAGPVPVQGRAAPVEAVTPDAPAVLQPGGATRADEDRDVRSISTPEPRRRRWSTPRPVATPRSSRHCGRRG